MYGNPAPPPEPTPATAPTPAAAPPTPVEPELDTASTPDVPVSSTRPTRVQHAADTGQPRGRSRSTTRTPAGKTRHTLYIDDEVATQLDATADRLVAELQGLVPKHRVLGALITAGLRDAPTVAAGLRAELLHELRAT